MTPEEMPQTLMEAVRYFADLDRCREFMRAVKWPDGKVTCPACKSENCGEIATRKMLKCNDCDKQFSYTVGTVFEASKISLDKWFVGLWALVNCKNGISSYELARALGVTQKTAWFMLHRIRKAMELTDGQDDQFDGPAEADATYVGGLAAKLARKLAGVSKEAVDAKVARDKAKRIKKRNKKK